MCRASVIMLLALLCLGCEAPPLSQSPSSNKEIIVTKLFDHEGCSAYKFQDGGVRSVYYVVCRGSSQTAWDETRWNGKVTYSVPMEVQTEWVR